MHESEIQFLLNLVLNMKLSGDAKKLCLERIGKIEESLRQPPRPFLQPYSDPGTQRSQNNPAAQAPSTQRLLDQAQLSPPPLAAPIHIPVAARDKETGMVNVVTSTTAGGSTRGPSKIFR